MSKLEKALKQAIVAKSTRTDETSNDDSIAVNVDKTKYHDGEISLMGEPVLKSKKELEKRKIIYPDMENTKVIDQFREIRTNIYQAIRKNNAPILITSVAGHTGNSFVVKNIATAISLDDSKTSLVVDCNLANSGFKDLIEDADNTVGITDYIERDIPVEDIIKPVGINRMRLIYAGTKKESVTDYLTSSRLRKLFNELQQRYSDRIILADSPSINDHADAKILSNLFAHVILVIPYRKVSQSQIATAIDTIGKEKIIGVVINREPRFLSIFKFK